MVGKWLGVAGLEATAVAELLARDGHGVKQKVAAPTSAAPARQVRHLAA
jgi:hypothetical protein